MSEKLRKAASAVLVCGEKILMMKRQNSLLAFPGYHAFPGGKLDKQDKSECSLKAQGGDDHLLNCLAREVLEEIGVNLIELQEQEEIKQINLIGRADTPDFNPIRFSTFFFLVELKNIPQLNPDSAEIAGLDWKMPTDWLDLYNKGKMALVPPITYLLKSMASSKNLELPINMNFEFDEDNEVPIIENIIGVHQAMPLTNTLPPAERTNCFLIGDKDKVVLDPASKDEREKKKLLNSLRPFSLKSIFLTHHHPDHRERVNEIARELNLPILSSLKTKENIEKYEPDFFKQIHWQPVTSGEKVTTWLGQDVLVLSVPGHDNGQLGIYPQNKEWFIVGDLIQGIGTVVIGGEESDMGDYFDSLEQVIKMDPAFIVPSHGIPMGGIFRLEETLKHRKMREDQVLKLHQEGRSEEEILKEVYYNIDERLLPYALMNIKSHLKKLKKEGRIS